MNIFVLDDDLNLCAESHVDKHVVKMVLESAQLLCNAHSVAPYKCTHFNHPCSIWVRTSLDNYFWLVEFGLKLAKEYTHRYDRIHKSEEVINWCSKNIPNIPKVGKTEHALAMPEEFRTKNAVDSYRMYYKYKISNGLSLSYKRRSIPKWLI